MAILRSLLGLALALLIQTYPLNNLSCYDGDTCTADVYLGMDVVLKDQTMRLSHIDTPEVTGEDKEAGIVSRDALRDVVRSSGQIEGYFEGKGSFKRWLVTLWGRDHSLNINSWMVRQGYALPR